TPAYDPAPVEARWSSFWERRGFFRADPAAAAAPYGIVIPPPNITGSLHLGHALNNTLQDVLIRWRRMAGDAALWIPGTDHAGIATQNVVERQLMAEGQSRELLGRDAFVRRVWQWRNESGRAIIAQLKRLGASCDWSREAFTMDEPRQAAVREAFVRLFKDGLIYRGQRLINWCPRCQTALSDIEVEHEETRGKMYYIKYPLADDPDLFLTVATTRPETLLGDTAVAVHPDDPRYNEWIDKTVLLPLTSRRIPIVGDAILVDREFGTGAVKITPAHDFNDEKAGQRHNLPKISILDEHGRIQPFLEEHGVDPAVRGDITQLSVAEARPRVERWLRERGQLLKVEDHTHPLGKCYRCRTVVEPYLSPQWFVRVNDPGKSLAKAAIDAVEGDQPAIRFIPEGWTNNYLGWMRQIEDWCISRQIWWGHQIPAWYCQQCNQDALLHTTPDGTPIVGIDARPIVELTPPERCPVCGQSELIQDPDVLDTWFSSALWPFSTLGWPQETDELKTFYPTNTLVTSFDIIFFWVARMIMFGLYFKKQAPFRTVYIHALVRDAEGQKMSKSKGNVIDPLVMMDKYGTDALRFTLAAMASPGRDIRLAEERIAGYRNFANKLWNAARFVLMNLDGPRDSRPAAERSLYNRWIISRLQRCIADTQQALAAYRFDEAANHLYHFTWNEYCDWYIEFSKSSLNDTGSPAAAMTRATLAESFETLLRLLHPFMPFITEELWQAFPHEGESIMVTPYPAPLPGMTDDTAEQDVEMIQAIVTGFRDMRSVHGIAPSHKLPGFVIVTDPQAARRVKAAADMVARLARLSRITVNPSDEPVHAAEGILEGRDARLLIALPAETMELAQEHAKEAARKEKRIKELAAQIERDEKTLANAQFLAKAPPHEVEKIRARHRENQAELKLMRESS
ncbi:MAG: valine--tRNA ligase, partial [Nitrospirota bacterium]